MHIAFYTNAYYPVISGVVRSVSEFRKALSELGNIVFVFAQHADDYEDTEPFIFRYPSINLTWPVDVPASIPISPFIDQLLPPLKLDVIHAHHPILLGQAAAHKAADLDLPLVFTYHTQYREYTHYIPIPQERIQEFLQGAVQNWLHDFMSRCQHIVVPSESMLENLIEEYGLEGQYSVIPTGIDIRYYQQADGRELRQRKGWGNDKVMISVGRLAQEKNWKTLITACAQVLNQLKNVRLVLIGDGPERKSLENLVTELGIASKVEFVGKLPFDEIPTYLKAADLFVFASVTETQGIVTMEAIASGLPVVAVDATGTSDALDHGVQGLLTDNDPNALAHAIHRVLSEEGLLEHFSLAAQEKAQSFDIFGQAKKLISAYEQAIQAKQTGQTVKITREKKALKLIDLPG